MKIATIVIPDDAPQWVSQLVNNIVDYVDNVKRGPQALTDYSLASPPLATRFRRSLIYDTQGTVPAFSDEAGNWKDLVPASASLTALIANSTLQNVVASTYTPTLTNTANISSSSALQCQYMRVGNVVTVSGGVTLTPTLVATLTTLGISLPIASSFSATQNLGGTADSAAVASASAAVFADTVNARATFQMISVGAGSETFYFSFTYLII